MKAAVRDTGLILEAEGHRVAVEDPAYPVDGGVRFIRRWLAGVALDAEHLDPARLEDRTRRMVRAGRFVQRRGWAALAEQDPFGAEMARFFERVDILVMPTLAATAVPVGHWRGGWMRTTLGCANWVMTAQWNLAGMAAASLPAGLGRDGLPLAVQLVAPAGRERLVLEVAKMIQRRRPFPSL